MDKEMKRNCANCRKGMFDSCKELKENETYQAIVAKGELFSEEEFTFKEAHCCDDFKSRYIEYPIEVSKVNTDCNVLSLREKDIGRFVRIRPCSKEYEGKTYLGIYIGDLPISIGISFNESSKELNASFHSNPGIFVMELNKIVYGCESFWSIIKSEEELKQISDIDIQNIWYMKALKSLSEAEGGEK